MSVRKFLLGLAILVATASLGGCSQQEGLSLQLKSPNVMLRKQAVITLSQSLRERAGRDFALLLGNPGPSAGAVSALAQCFGDESEEVRLVAIDALGNMGYPSATGPLLAVLGGQPSTAVTIKAVEALGKLQARAAVPALVAILEQDHTGDDERLLLTTIWSLGNIGDLAAYKPLFRLLGSDDAFVRYNVTQALKKLQ